MEEENEGILCPDCMQHIISLEKFNQGLICLSCTHRKSWAERKGEPYIKFKDLQIEKQRAIIDNLAKEQEQKELQVQQKDLDVNISLKEPEQENLFNIMNIEPVKEIKVVKNKPGTRLYPDGVYTYIKEHASPDLAVKDLYAQIISIWPEIENKLTKNILNKYLYSRKLPFRKLTDQEKSDLLVAAFSKNKEEKANKPKEINLQESISVENLEKPEEEIFHIPIKDINQIEANIKNTKEELYSDLDPIEDFDNSECVEYSEEARFEPIIEEVTQILNDKFKEVGCAVGYDYTVDDYIKAFTILRYLINNYKLIEQKRNDQWDIANAYQQDIVHEIENVVSKPGDTYLQDKCHVLRDVRRGYEIDKTCIGLMKPFLTTLTARTSEITKLIEKLEVQKSKQDDFIYIPKVDMSLVEKYSWAHDSNSRPGKLVNKSVLKTNNKLNKKEGNPIFIASCFLSGGGFGVFKKWTKEVSYPTIEEAQRVVELELDDIKKKNKNILVTDFNIHQKN